MFWCFPFPSIIRIPPIHLREMVSKMGIDIRHLFCYYIGIRYIVIRYNDSRYNVLRYNREHYGKK